MQLFIYRNVILFRSFLFQCLQTKVINDSRSHIYNYYCAVSNKLVEMIASRIDIKWRFLLSNHKSVTSIFSFGLFEVSWSITITVTVTVTILHNQLAIVICKQSVSVTVSNCIASISIILFARIIIPLRNCRLNASIICL